MTAVIVGYSLLAIVLLVVLFGIWKAAVHVGRVAERNETLEKEIADAKKHNAVESEVDSMPDADVTKRLSKWKRPF